MCDYFNNNEKFKEMEINNLFLFVNIIGIINDCIKFMIRKCGYDNYFFLFVW